MTTIDDFFVAAKEPSVELRHPRVADIARGIESGKQYQVEVYRPRGMVGLIKTKIYIHCQTEANGQQDRVIEHDWDEQLNAGLIRLGVRAIDSGNEMLRFALGLRDALVSVEREFGNGYYNAVLLDLVKESDLDRYEEIAEVLKHTYHDGTDRNEARYHRCRDAIAFGISGRARELVRNLNYSEEDAKEILPRAIATYIDHRFSVSSRRQLGLL
jgi:hypothetical protein